MSYRNDHDAALARVDALEAELHHMAREYDKLRAATPAPAAPRRRVWPAIAIAAGALSAFAIPIGAHLSASNAPPEPSIELAAPTPEPLDLHACVRAISSDPQLDATRADPRGAAVPVAAIAATIAPCRLQLAPGAWRDAEDQLAGAVSRIVVYYGHDPYALDGYRTAPQLWREYHAALAHRDAVLPVE